MKITIPGLFILLCASSVAQTKQINLPKSYIAFHTSETLKIDGKPDEISWEKSIWSDNYVDIEGIKTPKYRTRMKILWNDKFLYFLAELEEPHIWGNLTKRDAVIYHNNDFEIFIDPDGDTHNYMEFEMNALNTVWDLLLTKPYRNGATVLNDWNINGLKTAVAIDGTLNNPSDIDKKWTVEIAMPWSALVKQSKSKNIPKDKTWRINFSRVNWDLELKNDSYYRKKDSKTNKRLPEYNWVWSPQGVIAMHEPESWGYVHFSRKPVGSKDSFTYGKDEELKLRMYQYYKKYRSKIINFKTWKNATFPKSISVNNHTLEISAEFTSFNYIISVESPFTSNFLSITNDGEFMTTKGN